jgi:hypothetical protein
MLNQVVYVGQFKHTSWHNELKLPTMVVEVSRVEKNEKGEYDSDLIEGVMGSGFQTSKLFERLKEGQTVGIKGRLENITPNTRFTQTIVMIDKVTLLTAND